MTQAKIIATSGMSVVDGPYEVKLFPLNQDPPLTLISLNRIDYFVVAPVRASFPLKCKTGERRFLHLWLEESFILDMTARKLVLWRFRLSGFEKKIANDFGRIV